MGWINGMSRDITLLFVILSLTMDSELGWGNYWIMMGSKNKESLPFYHPRKENGFFSKVGNIEYLYKVYMFDAYE